jgi:hypothetical protein
LIIISFSSLEYTEYGLDYSSISKTVFIHISDIIIYFIKKIQVYPEPYGSGIHFLGIGHSFYKFPRTVITIEFSNERNADHPPL